MRKAQGDSFALLHQPHLGPPPDGTSRRREPRQVVNAAMANKERFDKMRDFFEGVGT
jgi:hypothetical protein